MGGMVNMKNVFSLVLLAVIASAASAPSAAFGAAKQSAPVSDTDPSWFRTPEAKGAGTRTVSVTSGQSLQDAFDKAQPGDVIEIGPGEYRASRGVVLLNSGTSNKWIVVRAASGAMPKIN